MNRKNCIRKIVGAGILLTLIFSIVAGGTTKIIATKETPVSTAPSTNIATPNAFTHTVLGELGVSTTCPYCPIAHAALKQIYAEGIYPFYYVTLVGDKNTHAATRIVTDYNYAGVPTVWFDGGYIVDVGAYTSVPTQVSWYRSTIVSCGNRAVPDIFARVSAEWLGSATINITVMVQNNGTSTYNGHIRVYVTEIISSMGWYDHGGNLYTFAFLDYALNNIPVSINAGATWQESTLWNGALHNDGHGHTFGGITPNNIKVIAAVFNDAWHQGYSDPPSGNPFNAYYVDEVAATWVNQPPNIPSNPVPENSASEVDIDTNLSWTGGDPNVGVGDTVTYDIYFGPNSPPPKIVSNQSATTYDPGTMNYNTTYYWQIIAWDSKGASTVGSLWSFTTEKPWIRGDCNGDKVINTVDVVYLINYLFIGGPEPVPIKSVGDVNGDGIVNISDVVYLINYLFINGPAPPP